MRIEEKAAKISTSSQGRENYQVCFLGSSQEQWLVTTPSTIQELKKKKMIRHMTYVL